MTENLSSSTSVSRQMYADMKSAFRAYAQNSAKSATAKETKTYKDNGQITRQAYYDMQNSFAERNKAAEKQERERAAEEEQANNSAKANDTQAQQKTEVQKFTLPKNTQTIISELRRNGLHRTMTEYDIAKEYNISYMKAREILDEVNKDANGFIREYNLPANTTVSYKVL